MARKPPPEHTRWKPGQTGNPGGRPKLPKELREVKEFTTDEIKRVIAKYMRMTKGELEVVLDKGNSKTLPMFEAMIASVISNAWKTGDFSKIEFLLNRSGHRQKNEMEVHQHNYTEEQQKKDEVVKKMDEAEVIRLLTKTGT